MKLLNSILWASLVTYACAAPAPPAKAATKAPATKAPAIKSLSTKAPIVAPAKPPATKVSQTKAPATSSGAKPSATDAPACTNPNCKPPTGNAAVLLPSDAKGAKPCDLISKYTYAFFAKSVKTVLGTNKALFYTSGLSYKAIDDAAAQNLQTIWDLWPQELYNNDLSSPTNTLRCIFNSPTDRQTYFDTMSKVMASNTKGTAQVMTVDVNAIPQDGIFAKTELPELEKAGGACTRVTAVTPDRKTTKIIFNRLANLLRRLVSGVDGEDKAVTEADEDASSSADETQHLVARSTVGNTGLTAQQIFNSFDNGQVKW